VSTKNRQSIASRVAVGATYWFLPPLILWVAAQGVVHARAQLAHEAMPRDDSGAAAAFEAIVPVLHHPRCMNCHSRGDFPRQGDDSHRHTMQVRRGPDGEGVNAVRCNTCHQDHNLAGLHMPPGAPDWHLPSPAMPMIWEGLTDRQLCELFKDPAGTVVVPLSRLWSTCTHHLYSGVGTPEAAALQSPHLSLSSQRKSKNGLKRERHVPWTLARQHPRLWVSRHSDLSQKRTFGKQ
jgi:hypothetical protein